MPRSPRRLQNPLRPSVRASKRGADLQRRYRNDGINGIDFNKTNSYDALGNAGDYLLVYLVGADNALPSAFSHGGAGASIIFQNTGDGNMEFVFSGDGTFLVETTGAGQADAPSGELTSFRGNSAIRLEANGQGDIVLRNTDTHGLIRLIDLGDGIEITSYGGPLNLRADGGIIITGGTSSLPTSDPGVSGQLWNSSGTLKVSP